jgi:hypothetical protein
MYVICACLRKVVSNTYCILFLFCFSSSCCQCRLMTPSMFSNVYLIYELYINHHMTVARTFTYEIVANHDQRLKLIKIMSITCSPFLIYIVAWEIWGTPLQITCE